MRLITSGGSLESGFCKPGTIVPFLSISKARYSSGMASTGMTMSARSMKTVLVKCWATGTLLLSVYLT